MRKFLPLLVMLLACMLFSAAAEGTTVYTCGDYQYILLEDGSAFITYYSGRDELLIIPEKLNSHPVSSISQDAFNFNSPIKEVTLPDSITHFPANPFMYCTDLSKINVSSENQHFTVIDGVLLDKAETTLICYPCALDASDYTIPQGVLTIGPYAFFFSKLSSIIIPDSVETIGDNAFRYCESLSDISIPSTVNSIGNGVFFCCYGIRQITIPDGVTSIGDLTFHSCVGLSQITLPDSITSIGDSAFFYCPLLKNITLPNGLISIGQNAFSECGSLARVTIPNSVVSIGENAFMNPNESILFSVSEGSYAEKWVIENNLEYQFTNAPDSLKN